MRPIPTIFVWIFCLTVLTGSAFAQTFPAKDAPKEKALTAVLTEAKDHLPTCGFSSVYIQASDIKELLSVKNCVGVRFYIAMEDPKQKFADVIAVAIRSDGKEIGDFLERKYHLARALDAHYPDEFKKMNVYTARKCVSNLRDGVAAFKPYAVFLGVESLNKLLNTSGATGIQIHSSGYASSGEEVRTMSIGAVAYSDKEVRDLGEKYLQSQLPCPVDCGVDNYLLWNN